MAIRFLHTADWQLGVRRRFLGPEAQVDYRAARIAAIERLGALAVEQGCAFVVVAGDVFESNLIESRTLLQALEAMRTAGVLFYLLPGNHDPLDTASIYRSRPLVENLPDNVKILDRDDRLTVADGVELVGVPWRSKRPESDRVADVAAALPPAEDRLRIVAGHGPADDQRPDLDSHRLISVARVEQALSEGRLHYLALGDRHSLSRVGESGRIWYPGTPEPTAFREQLPGRVLVVDLDATGARVEPHEIGCWRFVERSMVLTNGAGVTALSRWLDGLADKRTTALRLELSGRLTLREAAGLDEVLAGARDLFAAIDPEAPDRAVERVAAGGDLGEVELSGFARSAVERLTREGKGTSDEAALARDALALLYRLARGHLPKGSA